MKKQANGLLKSFGYAFKGITALIKGERNAKLHLLATLAIITAGVLVHLSAIEWCLIFLAIGLVFVAEGMNTAIEHLADFASPDTDKRIALVKDVAAGAVLIAALIALIIAGFIFLPKFLN